MGKIKGGYILMSRKRLKSELMDKPPLWSKLWDWMLLSAYWKAKDGIDRGQFFTTIADMQKAMSYKIGYRKQEPTKDQIRNAYEAFTKATMITTAKTTRGMIITVLNYDLYQDPKNYEGHSEDHDENGTKTTEGPHYKEERYKNNKNLYILPLENGNEYEVPQDFLSELTSLYPNVDLKNAFARMRGWCVSNPTKRKTSRGIKRFINTWLSREQEKVANLTPPPKAKTIEQIQAEMDADD